MIMGKSILHVNQGLGKNFVVGEIKGYYNDLTGKVIKDHESLKKQILPKTKNEKGKDVLFATTIFQYGLACYDLMLTQENEEISSQFKRCVDWAFNNQNDNGGWDISCYTNKTAPFGSMAQGEGASLLIRAYKHYGDEKYLLSAKKAIDLMLLPISEGGTALYKDNELFLLEFTSKACVMNGWIFSIFGLYDLIQVAEDKKYINSFNLTMNTLKSHLNDFKNKYWSLYDMAGHLASPFYHKLHIAQFEALCLVDKDSRLIEFKDRLISYQNKWFNRVRAFIVKSIQKVFGRD